MAFNTCLFGRTETTTHSDGSTGTSTYGLCGKWALHATTQNERKTSCPDCAKIVGKRRLAELKKQGTILEAIAYTKDELQAEYGRFPRVKSVYLVRHNSVEIGRVGIDNGWGKGWWIKSIEPTDEELNNRYGSNGIGTFSARDLALSFIPDLIADGKLFDGPGIAAIRKARADARAARIEQDLKQAEKMRQERLAQDARNAETYEGLLSIQDRLISGELKLTNHEASALAQALEEAKGKLRGQAALAASPD